MTETAEATPATETVGPREAAQQVGRDLHGDGTPPSIYQALNAVMKDVGAVSKTERNNHSNYNFRGIDAVVNASSPMLRRHGVIVVPNLVSVKYDDVKTSTNKLQTACRVVVDYTFYGPTGDSITCTVAGEAWDGGDKSTPQAMSVAFRIALLQALALPTDEVEVDSITHERVEVRPMQEHQLSSMQAGFKACGMGGDEGRDARLALFKDTLGRETKGGDLTEDEAAAVIVALNQRYTAEQALSNSLGAKPLDQEQKQADAQSDAADPDAEAARYADQTAHADTTGEPKL